MDVVGLPRLVGPHLVEALLLCREHQGVAVRHRQVVPAGLLEILGALELVDLFRLPPLPLDDEGVVMDVATPLLRPPLPDAVHLCLLAGVPVTESSHISK